MPSLTALLMIAALYWGQAPACGQPTITAADLPQTVVGLAETPCRITVDPSRFTKAGQACMVVLHEYGHLLGLGHSGDPDNIMYPVLGPPRWPCRW